MKIKILAIVVCALVSGAAAAQSVGISAEVGTLGAGVHLTVPLPESLSARIGFNGYRYGYTGSTSDVDYDFKLKLQTIDALLDWYPTSNSSFRLSAGLIHNGNKITSTGKPSVNGTYTINGNTYTTAEAGVVNGEIDFRSAAPYLGLGWGNAASKEKGWGFTSDLGVVFQGSPSSNLSSSGCVASAQVCTQLYSDLNVENTNLESKMNNFKYYPVIRVGISYSF
ncbi:hypothetical protein AAKU67_003690 [Oxalobacteraceae bacterium GrIS 2.11]